MVSFFFTKIGGQIPAFFMFLLFVRCTEECCDRRETTFLPWLGSAKYKEKSVGYYT